MLGEKFHRESNENQMQSNFEVTGAAADHTLANPGPTLGQPWPVPSPYPGLTQRAHPGPIV